MQLVYTEAGADRSSETLANLATLVGADSQLSTYPNGAVFALFWSSVTVQ